METMTENTTSKNITLHYKAVPRIAEVHTTQPTIVNKPKFARIVKNPLLWAAIIWVTICILLVLEVMYR
jgi:hypothetical protein